MAFSLYRRLLVLPCSLVKDLQNSVLQFLARLSLAAALVALRCLVVHHLLRHCPCLCLTDLAINAKSCGDHAANVAHVAGNDDSGALLGQFGESIDVLLGDCEADGTAGTILALSDALAHGVDTLSCRSRLEENSLRLTICLIDPLRAHSLRRENHTLFLSFGNVDRASTLTFRLENFGALGSLCGDLTVHGLDNGSGRVDVADLVSQASDAPCFSGVVDGGGDVCIQGCALLENMIEGELADLGAHGGLRELRNGVFGI